MTSRAGPAALLMATAAWGSVIVTIKIAARGLPVLTITLIEVAATLAVLGAVIGLRPGRRRLPRPSKALAIAGVLEPGLSYPLINAGLARTSGTHAAVIIGLESVLVVILAAAVARARPSGRVLLALTLAVGGAAFLGGSDGGTATTGGDLLVFVGVLTAAAYVIVAQQLAASFDAVLLTFYQFLFGGVVIVAVTAVSLAIEGGSLLGDPSAGELAAAVATGVLGSAIAFVLYNWSLSRVSATLAGTALTLIPVFGIVFSASFLGEAITISTVVATVVVLTGVSLASGGGPSGQAEQNPTTQRSTSSSPSS